MLQILKMVEQIEMTDLTSRKLATPCKYEGIGSAMAAELMIGFWFGIGVILASMMVASLDYYTEELMSSK